MNQLSGKINGAAGVFEAPDRPSPLRTGVANMAKGKYTRTAAHIEHLKRAAFIRNGSLTPEQRFWTKVEKTDSCWLWRGRIQKQGYGEHIINNKHLRAHRYSWEMANGSIPPGVYVCHQCDNRVCVRPDHLFLGTAAENMNDAASKGRMVRKLNPELVRQLRALSASGVASVQLAQQFGISETQVGRAISRRTYKHVE